MNKKVITWIFFAIIILVVVGIVIKNWDWIKGIFGGGGKKVKSKEDAIKILIKAKPSRTEVSLKEFGTDYLIAWAQGIKDEKSSFTLNDIEYSTDSGKKI